VLDFVERECVRPSGWRANCRQGAPRRANGSRCSWRYIPQHLRRHHVAALLLKVENVMGSDRMMWLAVIAGIAMELSGCTKSPSGPPNLILITIDTLRADHLSYYGYHRATSPNLDALARDGTAFSRCYTQSVTTRASHVTIFTSCLPRTHGVLWNGQEFPLERASLMSILRDHGYITAGFTSSSVLNASSGVQHWLDYFDDARLTIDVKRPAVAKRPARSTLQAAQRYLAALPHDRPFFVWIHLIDPHGPYAAPVDADRFVGDSFAKPGQRELPLGAGDAVLGQIPSYQILNGNRDPDYYVARYDGEIRYADEALGDFFQELRSLRLFDSALIAVTADHGETLDEPTHRCFFSHGTIAYEEVSRVPLIVREPGGHRRLGSLDSTRPVMSMDIAPTVLDLMGFEIPSAFEGKSLLRASHDADTVIFSMGTYGSMPQRVIGTQFSALRGQWRYIFNTLDGTEEIYDHQTDPGEQKNLVADGPSALAELRSEVQTYLTKPHAEMRVPEVSAGQRKALRALGYVQ
jgi:arylsulfatase A-like enzyme